MSRRNAIPVRSTRITATVSVTLVLIVLGIVGLLGLAAHSIGTQVRQQLGFVVILNDNITPQHTSSLMRHLKSRPYAAAVTHSSPEQVMERWKQMSGADDTDLLGINPFSPEIEIGVKARWARTDSMTAISRELRALPDVADVSMHADMVDAVNSTMRSLTLALGIVALALLLISFVLINNTVRLTVYARRFSIHTMKLVGATAAFIRRPFVVQAVVSGIVAGMIAAVVLLGVLFYADTFDSRISALITPTGAACVLACVFVVGIAICCVASLAAANKYLRRSYDELFR